MSDPTASDDPKVENEHQVTPKNMLVCKEERNRLVSIKKEEIFSEDETKQRDEDNVEMEDQKFVLDDDEIEIKTEDPDFSRFDGSSLRTVKTILPLVSVPSSSANSAAKCCSVCVLLNRHFSTHNFMDKLAIIERGRPKPTLSKLTTKIKTCTRYFQVDLYEQYEWLTGCETMCKLFCWSCLLFTNDNGVWNKSGFCDLNNLHKVIKRHTISQAHLQAVIKEKIFGKSRIEHAIDEQLKISHRKHNELVEKNRATLKSLIDVVCFLGTQELGLKGHDESAASTNFIDLVSLLSNSNVGLKNHLEQSTVFRGTSNRIQNDLISATATVVLHRIKLDIKKTRFVAIVLDETTDVTNISHISVVLRYIADDNVQERFLKFLDVSSNRTADVMHQAVCDIIADFEVGDKLVAHSYDGAAVMTGHLGGLQAKVRDTFPRALFMHCFAHRLNSILFQSVAHIKECKIFFSTLSGMAAFFSKSGKRTQALDLIVQKMLPKVAPTRWNYNGRLVQTVHEYRLPLIELFENILENSCDWDTETLNGSKGYLEYLKRDFDFNFLLNIFADIFPLCDRLFNIFQNKLNDFGLCVEKIEEFKSVIKSKRNYFEAIWERTLQNGDTEPQRKRLRTDRVEDVASYRRLLFEIIDQIYGQIDNRFENFKDLKFLKLCNFSQFKNKSFPETAFQSLFPHYAKHFDVSALRSELTVIYATEDINSKNNASELLNFLKQTGLHKAFCEVLKLCELVLTLPATNASAEGGFSVLKRVKNFVRNSTNECRLSELSLLSIEKHLLKQLSERPSFYDDVIEEFAKKDGRIELHYK